MIVVIKAIIVLLTFGEKKLKKQGLEGETNSTF